MFLPFLLCFWQMQAADPVRRVEAAEMQMQAHAASLRQANSHAIGAERAEFEKRFNALVQAIGEFSNAYNGSAGAVWPEKKARALENAMRDLERRGHLTANASDATR